MPGGLPHPCDAVKQLIVFNFVELTFVFTNYVRQSQRKIILYDSFPRIACSINVISQLSLFYSFLKEPQAALKVILTFQYFIFLRLIIRWVHCKYYFTLVILKIPHLLERPWKWSNSITWNWLAFHCSKKRHYFIYSRHHTHLLFCLLRSTKTVLQI